MSMYTNQIRELLNIPEDKCGDVDIHKILGLLKILDGVVNDNDECSDCGNERSTCDYCWKTYCSTCIAMYCTLCDKWVCTSCIKRTEYIFDGCEEYEDLICPGCDKQV